ncbi:hypothetical protein R6Q57_018922 [Mikania cordata]
MFDGWKNTANRSKQLYGSYHGTQSYAQRRYDEVKEGGVPQHVEGWRDMHFKGSSGWYNQLAEQHWENITDELNKAKSTSDGDDTPVDEVEVLQRSLGERREHVRGVGRKVKSITPDMSPHMALGVGHGKEAGKKPPIRARPGIPGPQKWGGEIGVSSPIVAERWEGVK